MAYYSTSDERYNGYYEYGAGYYDAPSYLNNVYVIAESDWAYGLCNDNYYTGDEDVYSLGILSTGYYTIDVDNFTWDYGYYDYGYIDYFRILDNYGNVVSTSYSTYSDIYLTVNYASTYYLEIVGPNYGEAQYAAAYIKTGELALINYPAISALYVSGGTISGETLSVSGTYTDINGIPLVGLISAIIWYRTDGYTTEEIIGHTADTYTLTENDVGYYVGYAYGFIDSDGFIESFDTTWSSSLITTSVPVNNIPTLTSFVANAAINEDAAYSYNTSVHFNDIDSNDVLTYSATLSNGSALPIWLSINTTTGVLSGTPLNGDVGVIDVTVTATDIAGLSVSDTYTLTVNNSNLLTLTQVSQHGMAHLIIILIMRSLPMVQPMHKQVLMHKPWVAH